MGASRGCLEGLDQQPAANRLVEVPLATLQEAEHFQGRVIRPKSKLTKEVMGPGPGSQTSCVTRVEALNRSEHWSVCKMDTIMPVSQGHCKGGIK